MEFYLHSLVCLHGVYWNFILVFIFIYLFLLFFSSFILFYSLFPFSHIPRSYVLRLFIAFSPRILNCTVHVTTLVAVLFRNMLLTLDHSNLGHDIVHFGKQMPTFRRSLLSVFRLKMSKWLTFLALTQRSYINRYQYFKGTCRFRLLHRRWKQNILPKH